MTGLTEGIEIGNENEVLSFTYSLHGVDRLRDDRSIFKTENFKSASTAHDYLFEIKYFFTFPFKFSEIARSQLLIHLHYRIFLLGSSFPSINNTRSSFSSVGISFHNLDIGSLSHLILPLQKGSIELEEYVLFRSQLDKSRESIDSKSEVFQKLYVYFNYEYIQSNKYVAVGTTRDSTLQRVTHI